MLCLKIFDVEVVTRVDIFFQDKIIFMACRSFPNPPTFSVQKIPRFVLQNFVRPTLSLDAIKLIISVFLNFIIQLKFTTISRSNFSSGSLERERESFEGKVRRRLGFGFFFSLIDQLTATLTIKKYITSFVPLIINSAKINCTLCRKMNDDMKWNENVKKPQSRLRTLITLPVSFHFPVA